MGTAVPQGHAHSRTVALGATLPAWPRMAQAMSVGLAGYGVSLVLFVLALRGQREAGFKR